MQQYPAQLNLLGPTYIQGDLGLKIPKRRGNPNFKAKWNSATKVVRLPIQWAHRAIEQCRQWENGEDCPMLHSPDRKIQEINPDQIWLDPKRFQYKIGYSDSGSTGSLSGVRVWDENLAGIILVWRDPDDGLAYVVNGHNRVSLAKKLGVSSLVCRFLSANSANEARFIGAMANIAEGRGSAIDAGKLFRERSLSKEQLQRSGIPLKEKMASDGLALAQLPGYIFDRVISGDIPLSTGVAIGSSELNHDQQSELLKLIERSTRSITLEMIGELADTVRSSSENSVTQSTLFGLEVLNQSTAIYRAEVQSLIKRQLKREKRLFTTVGNKRNATELQKGNNQIDIESSQVISDRADQVLRCFDLLKNQSGPISRAIDDCVTQLCDGTGRNIAIAQALSTIYEVVELGVA